MASLLVLYLYLISLIFTRIEALHLHPVPKTAFLWDAMPYFGGWTPKPTAAPVPHELYRRTPDSTCGYIDKLKKDALTCITGYCGFNTDVGIFACCGKVKGRSLTDCHFQTTCYNYGERCDARCIADSSKVFCDSATPSCVKYTFPGRSLAALGCGQVETIISVYPTYTMHMQPNMTTSRGPPMLSAPSGLPTPTGNPTGGGVPPGILTSFLSTHPASPSSSSLPQTAGGPFQHEAPFARANWLAVGAAAALYGFI